MILLAHVRRVLAHRPWLYWSAVGVLALVAGLLVSRAASRIEAAQAAWGEPRSVYVAISAVEPGTPLAASTQRRELPAPLVPAAAVTELDPGATARQRIAPGEVVVRQDVSAVAAPQALIPDGWLAVSVAEAASTGVRAGDAVSVASGGVMLARDGVVVGTTGESVLVAVPAEDAALVAHAASSGDAALLVKSR